jgi:hypothetical protein
MDNWAEDLGRKKLRSFQRAALCSSLAQSRGRNDREQVRRTDGRDLEVEKTVRPATTSDSETATELWSRPDKTSRATGARSRVPKAGGAAVTLGWKFEHVSIVLVMRRDAA